MVGSILWALLLASLATTTTTAQVAFNIPSFSLSVLNGTFPNGFSINPPASVTSAAAIMLTPAQPYVYGSAYFNVSIPLTSSFSTNFTITVASCSGSNPPCGDGFAFNLITGNLTFTATNASWGLGIMSGGAAPFACVGTRTYSQNFIALWYTASQDPTRPPPPTASSGSSNTPSFSYWVDYFVYDGGQSILLVYQSPTITTTKPSSPKLSFPQFNLSAPGVFGSGATEYNIGFSAATGGAMGIQSLTRWGFQEIVGPLPLPTCPTISQYFSPTSLVCASCSVGQMIDPDNIFQCIPGPYCSASESNLAFFNQTAYGFVSVGQCLYGYELPDGISSITRACVLINDTAVWNAPSTACQEVVCDAIANDGNAAWPRAFTGLVTGQCLTQYRPINNTIWPTRNCSIGPTGNSAVWGVIFDPCELVECPAVSGDGNAGWPQIIPTANVRGSCLFAYEPNPVGSLPIRDCQLNSDLVTTTWGLVTNPCTLILCEEIQEANASWVEIAPTNDIVGTCDAGFEAIPGTDGPTRNCTVTSDGDATQWGPIANVCQLILCPLIESEGNATWPLSAPGTIQGTCIKGHGPGEYPPSRLCILNDTGTSVSWGPISNPCDANMCPSLNNDGNAFWPETVQGNIARGACLAGFYGAPTRPCHFDGTWGPISTTVGTTCSSQPPDQNSDQNSDTSGTPMPGPNQLAIILSTTLVSVLLVCLVVAGFIICKLFRRQKVLEDLTEVLLKPNVGDEAVQSTDPKEM